MATKGIANPKLPQHRPSRFMALYPLHQAFSCKRDVFASSFGGRFRHRRAKAIEELKRQIEERWPGKAVKRSVSTPDRVQCTAARQVRSHPAAMTKEEMKMENEGTRKIMPHHPNFHASVTCVRVPVYRSLSALSAPRYDKPVTGRWRCAHGFEEGARTRPRGRTGERKKYPMPLFTSEKCNCEVGHVARTARWKTA